MLEEVKWPAPEEFVLPVRKKKYMDVHGVMDRCHQRVVGALSVDEKPLNILMNSRHGMGKSLMVATLAEVLRESLKQVVPLVVFDCSDETKNTHLMGSRIIDYEGRTPFKGGPFPVAIHLANETGLCILALEEMSALGTGSQKDVNKITDWRDGIFVPTLGRTIRLHENANLLVIATMNPSSYGGGIFSLNEDLSSRFVQEVIPWPTMEQETEILKMICPFSSTDEITRAIQLAKETRTPATETQLSTRELAVLLLDLFCLPKSREAALRCIVNKFQGTEKALIADKVDAIFKTKLKKLVDEER